MNRNDHYLVTGASGFLGAVISRELLTRGFRVTGLARSGQGVSADITKPFALDAELGPDVVVHAAGKAHIVPRNEAEAQSFYDVNFQGTIHLCTALDDLPVPPKSFVFISTVAVYGVDAGEMISEDHPLLGATPYAKSKIMAEEWLTEWAAKRNIRLGILRLPLVAGPNPPGNLGAMIRGIRSGKYASIGAGKAKKSMVWHTDIAGILPALAQVGASFNLTDGQHPTFRQLELVIAQKLGKQPPATMPLYLARIAGFLGDMLGKKFPINTDKLKKITSTLTFDDSKARQILGWAPAAVLDKLREEL